MSRTITIATPENITVTYQVAGIASRLLASLIDLLLQVGLLLGISFFLRQIAAVSSLFSAGIGSLVSFVSILVMFVIMFAYATIFEMMWGGRTPGKRLLGLRVIREGGYPINLVSSASRNVLRLIDLGLIPLGASPLLLWGLPGLICIFFSPGYKRIGDWAAG